MATEAEEKIEHGGFAFPTPEIRAPNGSVLSAGQDGMSMRDYIACQALVGIGNWTPGTTVDSWEFSEMRKRRAEWAYRQADAMIKARKAGA